VLPERDDNVCVEATRLYLGLGLGQFLFYRCSVILYGKQMQMQMQNHNNINQTTANQTELIMKTPNTTYVNYRAQRRRPVGHDTHTGIFTTHHVAQ